ncbi:MAG: hypothetical protein MJA28_07440 [Gammaproteobacteria bacterium]|nr:hypothetical protein [Gammaproteobacteria bacterium]
MIGDKKRDPRFWMIPLIAVGFGLLTIKRGGTILFGEDAADLLRDVQ